MTNVIHVDRNKVINNQNQIIMTNLEWFLCYIICSIIAGVKQTQCYPIPLSPKQEWNVAIAYLFGPLWLTIAIIRQVIMETWQ